MAEIDPWGSEAIENYDKVAEAVQAICTRDKVFDMTTVFLVMADYAQQYMRMMDEKAPEVTPATRSTTS